MTTEHAVIADFQAVLKGERDRVRRDVRQLKRSGKLTPATVYDVTYSQRMYLRAISKSADQLVDEWVDSALAEAL